MDGKDLDEMFGPEDEANLEAYQSSLIDDLEMRYGWDGDWSKVVDQYDGTR